MSSGCAIEDEDMRGEWCSSGRRTTEPLERNGMLERTPLPQTETYTYIYIYIQIYAHGCTYIYVLYGDGHEPDHACVGNKQCPNTRQALP